MIERGSENMSKVGKFWTDSVAYVALVLGAGISIAGNVMDTYRIRGEAVDTLDLAMAALWPALVVLMVEIFVSARWIGLGRSMQTLRWVGCLAIGTMAMRVSWVHLNDLMLSRGQKTDVAILGPLAIDALAIMATALILAGRGQVAPVAPRMTVERTDTQPEIVDPPEWQTRPAPSVADEASHYLERLSTELDATTTPAVPLDVRPVSPAPSRNEVKPESVPDRAKVYLAAWSLTEPGRRPTATDRNTLLATEFGVSTRTVRRWATALDETQSERDAVSEARGY
jgi:hypothetical protein